MTPCHVETISSLPASGGTAILYYVQYEDPLFFPFLFPILGCLGVYKSPFIHAAIYRLYQLPRLALSACHLLFSCTYGYGVQALALAAAQVSNFGDSPPLCRQHGKIWGKLGTTISDTVTDQARASPLTGRRASFSHDRRREEAQKKRCSLPR